MQERTVVMWCLKMGFPRRADMFGMVGIFVVGKQVHKFLRTGAKKQQDGQAADNNAMENAFDHRRKGSVFQPGGDRFNLKLDKCAPNFTFALKFSHTSKNNS